MWKILPPKSVIPDEELSFEVLEKRKLRKRFEYFALFLAIVYCAFMWRYILR